MIEFEKVTTRGGDRGDTSLYNGERLSKGSPVFDVLGGLDELSSWLGVVKASIEEGNAREKIGGIQEKLLVIGAEVATPKYDALFKQIPHLTAEDIESLERDEKALLEETEVPDSFILPGGSLHSAYTDVARTVCRRTERLLVNYIRSEGAVHLAPAQNYLNRLSDYLFILARSLDAAKENLC